MKSELEAIVMISRYEPSLNSGTGLSGIELTANLPSIVSMSDTLSQFTESLRLDIWTELGQSYSDCQ